MYCVNCTVHCYCHVSFPVVISLKVTDSPPQIVTYIKSLGTLPQHIRVYCLYWLQLADAGIKVEAEEAGGSGQTIPEELWPFSPPPHPPRGLPPVCTILSPGQLHNLEEVGPHQSQSTEVREAEASFGSLPIVNGYCMLMEQDLNVQCNSTMVTTDNTFITPHIAL